MNILITGASRGLGLEICRVLLAQNHTVYAVGRTVSEGVNGLREKFGNFKYKCVDLSDANAVKESVFGADFIPNAVRLDGLVNNAAAAYDDILTNLRAPDLRAMFELNVIAPIMLSKYAVRNMIYNGGGGSVVHISSVSTKTGYKGLSAYAASKGAIEAFSLNMAREWGAKGIRSNVVAPGFMETSMSASISEDDKRRIYARTSLKKATDINSVAETVAFLLSDAARSITGQCICIDSGTV